MAINQHLTKDDSNWQVLLVEDSIINQEVTKNMLIQMGCNVHIAVNGLEAVAVLKQRKFDLILMDCNMPELDGYGATRKIREQEKQQNKPSIPIIAFTTEAMPKTRERCFEAGMDDFLAKPLVFKNLQKMLKIWLESQNINKSGVKNLEIKNSVETDNQLLDKPLITDSESPLDLNFLNEMRQNLHTNQAIWLIDLFLQELPTYLTTIHQAITLQEGENLYLSAHKFKGASAILGAQRVVTICKKLETLGRSKEFAGTTELFTALKIECSYLETALKKQKPD